MTNNTNTCQLLHMYDTLTTDPNSCSLLELPRLVWYRLSDTTSLIVLEDFWISKEGRLCGVIHTVHLDATLAYVSNLTCLRFANQLERPTISSQPLMDPGSNPQRIIPGEIPGIKHPGGRLAPVEFFAISG